MLYNGAPNKNTTLQKKLNALQNLSSKTRTVKFVDPFHRFLAIFSNSADCGNIKKWLNGINIQVINKTIDFIFNKLFKHLISERLKNL